MTDARVAAMACIGGAVALGSSVAPVRFLGLFGLPADQATGAAVLGWRLMAARTAALSVLAARGNTTARDAFLPMQVLDQVAWWVGYRQRQLPLRTALLASSASGAIVVLDLSRRRSSRTAPTART